MRIREAMNALGLQKPKDFVSIARAWVFCSLLIIVLGLLKVTDVVPLGPEFRKAVVLWCVIAFLVGLVLILLCKKYVTPWMAQESLPEGYTRWFSRLFHIAAVVIILGLVVSPVAFFAWDDVQKSKITKNASLARQEFIIVTYDDEEEFDQGKLDRTLSELEQARRQLVGQWQELQDDLPIALHLFGDVRHIHTMVDDETTGGAVICQPHSVIVLVPLEEELPVLTEDTTNTPVHEMVHALMCSTLGQSAFYLLPRWYHEGMAQLYQNDGNTPGRLWNRWQMWLQRDRLMTPEVFCSNRGYDSSSHKKLLYISSQEFVRYLEKRHGRSTLNRVVDDVRSGATIEDFIMNSPRVFEDSLRDRLGGSCLDLYGEWIESW